VDNVSDRYVRYVDIQYLTWMALDALLDIYGGHRLYIVGWTRILRLDSGGQDIHFGRIWRSAIDSEIHLDDMDMLRYTWIRQRLLDFDNFHGILYPSYPFVSFGILTYPLISCGSKIQMKIKMI
jgi:hypothetical protein